jgi:hypothetical protein
LVKTFQCIPVVLKSLKLKVPVIISKAIIDNPMATIDTIDAEFVWSNQEKLFEAHPPIIIP